MNGSEPQMEHLESNNLQLSVGELVEFSARSGDLLNDSVAGPAALAGLRGHQKIQAGRDDSWLRETRLQAGLQIGDWQVTLTGRVDLLNLKAGPVVVEELKTTLVPPDSLPDNRRQLHWAQARVYAWMTQQKLLTEQKNCAEIDVRVSWYDLSRDQVDTAQRIYEAAELEAFVRSLLETYVVWCSQVHTQRRRMQASASCLRFPFPDYRPQQLQLARYIYRCVRERESLLLEAPTGSGKTLSVLYPTLKALGEGQVRQALYLTSRGPCQQVAVAAMQQLRGSGWQGSALLLQARDKACPCRSAEALGDADLFDTDNNCRRCVGFYDRLPGARLQCLSAGVIDAGALDSIAERHQVCPFALALEMLPWLDLVICDVNYLFDPLVKLAQFESGASQRLLLIDEAHNLPERARTMYSASLSTTDIAQLAVLVAERFPDSKRAQKVCRSLKKSLAALPLSTPPEQPPLQRLLAKINDLLLELMNLQSETSPGRPDLLPRHPDAPHCHPDAPHCHPDAPHCHPDASQDPPVQTSVLQDLQKKLLRYSRIAELFGDNHRHNVSREDRCVQSDLLCLDAGQQIGRVFTTVNNLIAFSATLTPMEFYEELLQPGSARQLQLPSSFPPGNQLLLLAGYIDTRWQQRDQSIEPLTRLIAAVYRARPGNYLVFFPSHQYLQRVYELFVQQYPQQGVLLQSPRESEAARQQFLQAFTAGNQPRLGFAVMGGIYAEAVDFTGEALSGCVVVSPALATPDRKQQWLQEIYRQRGLDGFAYASQFPGFTRVQQAAGRVIRSASDRGVVVLIDPRFQQAGYRRLFPAHWQPQESSSLTQLDTQLRQFWG